MSDEAYVDLGELFQVKKKSGIKKKVIAAIHKEMNNAVLKHGGWHMTPLNPQMPDGEKLIILVEEVGETARAITYDNGDADKLYDELIQVATMAAAWAQSTRRKGKAGRQWTA